MNKKNISIIISVFISAFVVSILSYILLTQRIELYSNARIGMAEDISLYSKVNKKVIEEIEKLPNVKEVGLKSDPASMKLGDDLFTIEKYDSKYFSMQKEFLKDGSFPLTSNEILISQKTSEDLKLKIGDYILIDEGNRLLKNKLLLPTRAYNENETFKVIKSEEYRISGIYNTKNKGSIQKVYSNIAIESEYYPCIKLKNLTKVYETKNDIEKIVGKDNYIIMNESLLKVFSIKENGLKMSTFFMDMILVPLIIIIIFTLMIKNIFNIWGIYKIQELSMYKSIGATDFQIYGLLLKDIVKISISPLILGEVTGLITIKAVFLKLFSLQENLANMEGVEFTFNWASIILINLILFTILTLAVTFPTRVISKIEILDGLRGNIGTKKFKKKKSDILFRELKLNNRKLIRPALVIMTTGLVFIGLIIGTGTIDKYNERRYYHESDFNFRLRYNTEDNLYPEIFSKIKEDYPAEESCISISKRYFVDSSEIKYSDEFSKIGFNKAFDKIFYNEEKKLINGTLIGLDNKRFSELSSKSDDVILVNLVQKNPKSFYENAEFIPFLDEKTQEIDIKMLEDFKLQEVKITKVLNKKIKNQEQIDLYNIILVTSIENFRKLMEESKKEFEINKMKFPIVYYNLDMKFKEENLKEYGVSIKDLMEKEVEANEKFAISNKLLSEEMERLNKKSMDFIGLLIFSTVILLNAANSYSSANLMFFNRRKEVGSLLSSGMEKEDLEKMLMSNMLKDMRLANLIAMFIVILIMALLARTLPYLDISTYLKMLPYKLILGVFLLVNLMNYLIYYLAMKKLMEEEIIDLLGNY